MTGKTIAILAAALLVAFQGPVQAGFVKGNGEVQFPDRTMPNDPERTHPSLTERSDTGKEKAPSHGNAWAPHIKGNLDFEK